MTWFPVLGSITLVDRRKVLHAAPDGDQFLLAKGARRLEGRRPRRTLSTLCGKKQVRPYFAATKSPRDAFEDATTLPWPPRLKVAERFGFSRCPACFVASGRPRPASSWDSLRERTAA